MESNEREQQLKLLEAQNQKFKKMLEIQKRIGSEHDIDELLPLIISEISLLMGADRTSLFLIDWEHMELRAKFAEGLAGEGFAIKLRMGIVGASVISRQVVNVSNAYDHPYFNPEIDQIAGFKTESILVAPILDGQEQVIGALELLNKDTGCFNEEDKAVIWREAGRLGAAGLANLGRSQARELVERLKKEVCCDRGSIFFLDEDQGNLVSIYADGLEQNICLNLNLGVAGLTAVSGKILNITDAAADERFDNRIDRQTGYQTETILGVPLTDRNGEVIGVVEVINKHEGVFDASDLEIMESLSGVIAIAITNAMMFAEHEMQFRSILEVMAASIDAKDRLTAGHSAKVTQYATGMAQELGYKKSEVDLIGIAALLHDYGKLGIDDQVLKKPGKLTATEYEHIKQHVTITRSILDKMRFARKYRNVPQIAAAHHEYMDGTGYDSGLRGKEIPFMAKIITVADVFEALTATRHYRQAMSLPEAFSILEQGAGTKFDAKAVSALKGYLLKNGEQAG